MDLDQLHTFLEIVRLKSFSKAAQTCYRTQPALDVQILPGRLPRLDPSVPPGATGAVASTLLVDATRGRPYAPNQNRAIGIFR